MKNIILFLLVITCMTFMSLDNSPYLSKNNKVNLPNPGNKNNLSSYSKLNMLRIGKDTAEQMIAAYDSITPFNTGVYFTKSVNFKYSVIKAEYDNLLAHSGTNGYTAATLGFSIHYAKYKSSNALISKYMRDHNILGWANRNTVIIQMTNNMDAALDENGEKVYMNMGDLCPTTCPN